MLNANNNPSRILLPEFAESLQATALSSLPDNAEVEDIEATIVPMYVSKQVKRNYHKKMKFLASIHSEPKFQTDLKAILERRKIHRSNEDKTIDEESEDWNKEEATLVPSLV